MTLLSPEYKGEVTVLDVQCSRYQHSGNIADLIVLTLSFTSLFGRYKTFHALIYRVEDSDGILLILLFVVPLVLGNPKTISRMYATTF